MALAQPAPMPAAAASAPTAAGSASVVPTAEPAALPSVVVRSTRQPRATTEGSHRYAGTAVTLFKGLDDLRSVPQPVTVLTRQFLDDRALPDLAEALRLTPGVVVDQVDSERVTYFSRGHQIDALQIDGLTVNQSGSVFIQPDMAVVDRIEVLRGAAGLLRGAGNPSATVNLVRKRPTRQLQASARLNLGSWDRQRVEADVSSALTASGQVRARVVAVHDTKDFFQQARHENRQLAYGVVELDLTPGTVLTASVQHTALDATGAWGNLPADLKGAALNLPRSTYLGAAWNRWNRENRQTFVDLQQQLGGDWSAQFSATQLRMHMVGDYGFKQSYFTRASNSDAYLFNVTTSAYGGDRIDQAGWSMLAQGPLVLMGRRHELVVGADGQRLDVVGTKGYFNLAPLRGVDIRTWNPFTSYPEPMVSASAGTAYAANDTSTRQAGIFGRGRFALADSAHLLVGARVSRWDYQVPAQPRANYRVDHELTPFIGLTQALSPQVTAYGSFTRIFAPQQAYNTSGTLLAPVRGKDLELGLKGQFDGGRSSAQAAIFRIDNDGKAIDDTSSPNPCLPAYTTGYCKTGAGLTRSQGLELEYAGELAPEWQLMASYTHTHTRTLVDNSAATIGQPLRSIDPRHLANLNTSYRFRGALAGLKVGAGLQSRSRSYVSSGALTTRQGGYTLLNALVGYDINRHLSLQLNANNLGDKVYYSKFSPTGIANYYGDPRSLSLSLRASL